MQYSTSQPSSPGLSPCVVAKFKRERLFFSDGKLKDPMPAANPRVLSKSVPNDEPTKCFIAAFT